MYHYPAAAEPEALADFAEDNERATAISLHKVGRLLPAAEKARGLERIRNSRNKHLAHRTAKTRLEIKLSTPIAPPKFADVDKLLRRAIRCVDLLNSSVRQSSYVFSIAKEIAQRQSEEFWFHFRWTD